MKCQATTKKGMCCKRAREKYISQPLCWQHQAKYCRILRERDRDEALDFLPLYTLSRM